MARHELLIKPSARRELERIRDGRAQDAVIAAIRCLAHDPRPSGCQKLVGGDRLYRIRVGVYRVIYEVLDRQLIVTVIRVGHRRDVYR